MLDIPQLGLSMLESARSRLAESCEDSLTFEDADLIIETAKSMVDDTDLRRGIRKTSKNSADQQRRERDVMRALTEALEVRRMG